MSPQQELAGGIEKLGLKMPIEGQDRLLQYLGLLLKWNRVHNLTAIRQIAPMVSAHLLDSLSVATVLSAEHLLDVGSGGGLPGIPLALLWPDAEITLIDSSQKKNSFFATSQNRIGHKKFDRGLFSCRSLAIARPFRCGYLACFCRLAGICHAGGQALQERRYPGGDEGYAAK